MYAWYFPKSQIFNYVPGRRHNWQSVVIWLPSRYEHTPYAIAYTEFGKWHKTRKARFEDGTHALMCKDFDVLCLAIQDIRGHTNGAGTQPLVVWDDMPEPVKQALNTVPEPFGQRRDQQVPFNNWNFQDNLEQAYVPSPGESGHGFSRTHRVTPP